MAQTLGAPPTEGLSDAAIQWLQKVQEIVEVGAGQRGAGEQRYITVEDLKSLSLADVAIINKVGVKPYKTVSLAPRAYAGSGVGDLTLPAGTNIINLNPPPRVENLQAYGTNDGASSAVLLMWEGTRYDTYGGANVYRASTNNYGTAVKIGGVGEGERMYADAGVNEAGTYFYWVRSISKVSGAPEGPLNQVGGTAPVFDTAAIAPAANANALNFQKNMVGINAASAVLGSAEVANLLIGGTIKSDNYVPGVSGWIIKK